ncbi:DnaA N-terminal domain-containing protein [Pelagibius sp. Alg239-R121]|uniref:DnaA N-terminal domain-containing protein n=1 Tax=Pelagibius sp. Alg239-R121 TaxID=2993448 RepID=UPI0024A71D23|nr:DnaA N-terminal domain-containing protein [Pelagibius sp. Alg239-R121]
MAFGLTDLLSDKEFRFLSIAVSMLNRRSLEHGAPHCYISGFLFRKLLGGISQRTLSRIKQNLERMGLIIRHYDKRNRPLEKAGIDLRPLLYRLEELQDRADDLFDSGREHFAEGREIDDTFYHDKSDMPGRQLSPPNSPIPTLDSYTVQTKAESSLNAPITTSLEDRPTGDSVGTIHQAAISAEQTSNSQDCSPMEISDFWHGRGQLGEVQNSKAREELLLAHQLSPLLQEYLSTSEIGQGDPKVVFKACYKLIEANFDERRNSGETFKWAIKKFGWRAVLILVCAIEDPTVQFPDRWFGWAVTKMPRTLDLSSNFERIKNQSNGEKAAKDPDDGPPPCGKDTEDPEELPAEQDPRGELMGNLKTYLVENKLVKPAEIDAWFGSVSIVEVTDDWVNLTAPSRFLCDWLNDNYIPKLKQAFTDLLGQSTGVRIKLQTIKNSH